MAPRVPPESEVLQYLQRCSNWGRWGADDQLGTLNYITPEMRKESAALVREGVSVTCARRIPTRGHEPDFAIPPMHYMASSGERWAGKATEVDQLQSSSDFFGLAFHGFAVTHVDSLAHIFRDGQMYNGVSADKVTTAEGATVGAVELLHNGVVGRGVLLDIPKLKGQKWLEPGQGVFPEDLQAAEEAAGVKVGTGDILLVRFGVMRRRNEEGPSRDVFSQRPGLHAACMPWLHQRQIAALASDSAQDLFPSGYPRLRAPAHQVGIVAMGLWLIDNCNLEDLAAACERYRRWEFLLTLAPLRIVNGTGSPVNPIALF